MKILAVCALIVALSGCIPIGIQGRTSAIAAPGALASAGSTSLQPGTAARSVSA